MENLDLNQIDSEYFKLFFALSPDLFAISKGDGYFQHLNSAWASTLGYSMEELLRIPYHDLIHPDDLARTKQIEASFNPRDASYGFENRYRCKDGSYRHFSWNAMKHSTRQLIFTVARDITHQKSLEASLKHEKMEAETQTENIHMLLSQVPALAAVTKGPDHVFAFANSDYCALLGNRSPVGMPVVDALPGIANETISILDHVYQTGSKYTAENMTMTADWEHKGSPSVRCFTFIYSPLKTSRGEVYGIWCLAFDVTEIKVMQERLEVSEKMASLGTIAAGVAHEINNPLAYMSGLLELMSRQINGLSTEVATSEKTTLLDKVKSFRRGLERISKIVKSLKTFSRTEEEAPEAVDIGEVLRATLQFADTEVKHRAQVHLDLVDLPPCWGNEGKLTQVFLNLVINAAHAIPVGRVNENSITVKARTIGASSVQISVTDTGCGIAPQNLGKIFEPFYTSKPVGEGTGLGLSICHGIIASMNGSISVESKVGVGTTFKVTLPVTAAISLPKKELQPAMTPSLNLEAKVDSQPGPIPKMQSVLVIDDEVSFGEVVGLCLETDFSVTVVNSVHDALIEISKNHHFDIILCDLMMPYQTGMDLYYNLARTSPGLQERMIFMTGGVFTTEASEFLSKIKMQKINKPFSMQELRDLISATCKIQTTKVA